jgi:hypothetical protein
MPKAQPKTRDFDRPIPSPDRALIQEKVTKEPFLFEIFAAREELLGKAADSV